jgi:hypothetical protein
MKLSVVGDEPSVVADAFADHFQSVYNTIVL